MLSDLGFGYFDFCLKMANGSKLPFGGKQAIFVGDFFQVRSPALLHLSLIGLTDQLCVQLPPVRGNRCFINPVWAEADILYVEFKTP